MTFDDDARAGLLHKYRTLQHLGDSRARMKAQGARAFPPEERPARRQAMQELAARFPGTLKELDLYDAVEVARRIAQLEGPVTLPWMAAVHHFHRVLAMLLAHRRGEASGISPELAARAGNPPHGRLSRLAVEVVAEELGMTLEAVIHCVSGPVGQPPPDQWLP